MNITLQKALHQSGSEILSSQLDPSCYASAMAEARGNSTLAIGIYAQKRAQLLFKKNQQASQRDKQRLAAMLLTQRKAPSVKTSWRSPLSILLCLTLFIGLLSATTALLAAITGQLSAQNITQITLIAAIGSCSCLSLAGWISQSHPRIKFLKIMLLTSTLAAGASLASGVYLIKNNIPIEWIS